MCAIRGNAGRQSGDVMFIPKGSSIEFGTPSTVRFLYVAAGKLAIAMNDFITEAWLRANHTLSEGGEIHLPADARLTPSARELLESRHLRVKFLDRRAPVCRG